MECRVCKSANLDSNKFCAQCGTVLTADPVIQAAIRQEIQTRLQDRNVVEVEVAERVYERLTKWGMIVLGVLAAALAILGVTSYDKLLKNAQDAASAAMSAKVDQASRDASTAMNAKVNEASEKFGKKADEKIGQLGQDFAERVNKESEAQIHKAVSDAIVGIQKQVSSENAQLKLQIANSAQSLKDDLEKRVGAACGENIVDFRQCHSSYPAGCSKFGTYDYYLNYLKNVTPSPPTGPVNFLNKAAFDNFNASTPSDLGQGNNHATYKAQLSSVGEGKQFGIVGYLYYYQKTGAESSNCELTGVENVDFHIGIGFDQALTSQVNAANPAQPPKVLQQNSVIVEMTPHYRAQFQPSAWTLANLKPVLGHKVRVVGQLLVDSEHNKPSDDCALASTPEQKNLCWRYSIWELHPVTSFQYCADDSCTQDSSDWIPLGAGR